VAIDGVPLVLATRGAPIQWPIILKLEGHTVGTTMQLGRLDIWTGVRGGVDWERIRGSDAPATPVGMGTGSALP
jgi:hypothetical protein